MIHQWIPAKVGDIVEKVDGGYLTDVKNGNRYFALDIYEGDNTAIILDTDGKLKRLCFPEEYIVLGNIKGMIDTKNEK